MTYGEAMVTSVDASGVATEIDLYSTVRSRWWRSWPGSNNPLPGRSGCTSSRRRFRRTRPTHTCPRCQQVRSRWGRRRGSSNPPYSFRLRGSQTLRQCCPAIVSVHGQHAPSWPWTARTFWCSPQERQVRDRQPKEIGLSQCPKFLKLRALFCALRTNSSDSRTSGSSSIPPRSIASDYFTTGSLLQGEVRKRFFVEMRAHALVRKH